MKRFFPLLVFLSSLQSYSSAQIDAIGSGGAISFDGIDDFIDYGDIYEDLELPFTISAWVWLDPSNTMGAPIFASRNCDPVYTGFRLIVNNNIISMDYGDGLGGNNPAFRRGKNANVNLLTGSWNHVTVVVKGVNDMDIFLNGVDVGGTYIGGSNLLMDSSKPGFASSGYFISNGTVYRLKGKIDDIRLWNRALLLDEIRTDMCVNLKGNEAGLIGYWDFNETEGNTVIDRSANHFNGTFKGNPLRVRSGAAIGDVSSYMYPTSSTTRSLSLVAGDQKIEVNNLSASVRGVQIYGVHSLPSNTTGLPANGVPTTYFGIFLAQQESSSSFSSKLTVDGDVPCSVFIREDNSSPSWKSSTPFNNNQKRVEVIQGPATNDVAFDLGPDLQLCNETQHEIRSGINPIDHTITWSTGETTPTIVAKKSGWYTVTAHADCTQAKDSIHVAFITPPGTFSLGNDVFTCQLQPIILTAPVSPSTDVTWDNGSETTTREITDFGTYWATLRNSCGSVSDTIHIKKLSVTYSVPNVITPNGDGLNDSFIISDDMDTPIVLEVFNRWGQRVFYSAAYDNRWSGSGVATGTYYYVLTDGCGAPKKGVLNILR